MQHCAVCNAWALLPGSLPRGAADTGTFQCMQQYFSSQGSRELKAGNVDELLRRAWKVIQIGQRCSRSAVGRKPLSFLMGESYFTKQWISKTETCLWRACCSFPKAVGKCIKGESGAFCLTPSKSCSHGTGVAALCLVSPFCCFLLSLQAYLSQSPPAIPLSSPRCGV